MKSLSLLIGSVIVLGLLLTLSRPAEVLSEQPPSGPQEFIGSEVCADCHTEMDLSEAGYNVVEEAGKNAHAFALSAPDPQYPIGTNDAGIPLPPGSSWDEFEYVLGGFGWKATFVYKDGSQLTGHGDVQYDLETGEWSAYRAGEALDFDVECARCHTTGISQVGSWNGVAEDSLGTWVEAGVQCEGCHGPSSLHVSRALTTSEGEVHVLQERCGDCHNNGGKDAPIPVVDRFVVNHAQYQELEGSRHGSLGFFTCATCHEPHLALKYAELIGEPNNNLPLKPIRKQCQDCHTLTETDHPAPVTCVDCHMPAANKSAVGLEFGNGGARGDIASHVWRINTAGVPRDSMFTADGAFVKPDASGWLSVTLDFACLGCHTDSGETLAWAAEYAQQIHPAVSTASERSDAGLHSDTPRISSYPNPFSDRVTIEYEIPHDATLELSIYNASGQRVAVLQQGERAAGMHTLTWDGRSDNGMPLSSGMYFVDMQAGAFVANHQILLVR